MKKTFSSLLVLALFGCAAKPTPPPAVITATTAPQPAPAVVSWVDRSDVNSKFLLETTAKFDPEGASELGLEAYDEKIVDYLPGHDARAREELGRVKRELEARLARETDREVQADLKILLLVIDRNLRSSQLHEEKEVPFMNVAQHVFSGLRGLLDDRVSASRHRAAVARLTAYAGIGSGKPLTVLAREHTTLALADKKKLPPAKMEVEKALQNSAVLTEGIEKMLQKHGLTGYETALVEYKKQLAEYDAWLKSQVLPKARSDFRLPPDLYAMRLEEVGVDLTPEKIADLGHRGFAEIQAELKTVAATVARDRKLPSSDYRDVAKALKKEQIGDGEVLPLYEKTLAELETAIRREKLLTLPKRPAKIRLASKAEGAAMPSPYFNPPRLIGNDGEPGEFVLPLSVPPAPGKKESKLDDFTFKSAVWTLTAHEARPGHELQFTSMIEAKISIARAVFAFNSANVEGWGLYAEYLARPFMPPEGQLVSLLYRLHRSARAFLDPELHLGKITPQAAHDLLVKDVNLSDVFANSEVERYTFRSPGQATSYFYGLTRLLETRKEVEERLGAKFELQKFDDFVLSKGLMPPALLREAALSELK